MAPDWKSNPLIHIVNNHKLCGICREKGECLMAGVKQAVKKSKVAIGSQISGKRFFIGLSFAANIAFVVVLITMMTSHVLDGMFMNEGLTRYCSSVNDSKFSDAGEKPKALRAYTCAAGDAKEYFDAGFQSYLDYKSIK